MLERTSSCLKAGARDTLNTAFRSNRPSRTTPTTLWHRSHGDSSLRHVIPAYSDTFLDFLYPPQALVWLSQHNARQLSAAKRRLSSLPTIRSPAITQYGACRSYSQNTQAAQNTDDELDGWWVNRNGKPDEVKSTDEKSKNQIKRERKKAEKVRRQNERSACDDGEGEDAFGTSEVDAHEWEDREWRRETEEERVQREITEGEAEIALDAKESLNRLMKLQREQINEIAISLAWRSYMACTETQRQDARLMNELLLWFASSKDKKAYAHCISLYWSIPVSSRTLETYRAVSMAFLDGGHTAFLLALHEEALENLPNGAQISRLLFSKAIEMHTWTVASTIRDVHHDFFSAPEMEHHINIFWFNVGEIPDIVRHAGALATRVWKTYGKKHPQSDRMRKLSLQLSKEAIRTFLQSPVASSMPLLKTYLPRQQLRLLFTTVLRLDPAATSFIETSNRQLLERYSTKATYQHVHTLASFLYLELLKRKDFKPNEAFFTTILQRIINWNPDVNILARNHQSVTIASVVEDYERHFPKVERSLYISLISLYAFRGDVQTMLKYRDELLAGSDSVYADVKESAWAEVYVHARRADIYSAVAAFESALLTAQENEDTLDIKAWNALLHAYSRTNDLEQALILLQRLLEQSGLQPDDYTFHPVMELLARRGDVTAVEQLLEHYDVCTKMKRTTALFGSYLTALVRSGRADDASQRLQDAVVEVKAGEMIGSLTKCFNIVLTAFALERNYTAAMHLHGLMQDERIRMDGNTFAALMQALLLQGQLSQAENILHEVMPKHGVEPNAFHYTLLMTGHLRARSPDVALKVYARMKSLNIKPTLSCEQVYLQARTAVESSNSQQMDVNRNKPLHGALQELNRIMENLDASILASKQPEYGTRHGGGTQRIAVLFERLISAHTRRDCFDAVRKLLVSYRSKSIQMGAEVALDAIPIRMLAALMKALLRNEDHDSVEKYWILAREQAEVITRTIPIPNFTSPGSIPSTSTSIAFSTAPPVLQELLTTPADPATGFSTSNKPQPPPPIEPPPAPPTSTTMALPQTSSPPATYRAILSRPLQYHLTSLLQQSRTTTALQTFATHLSRGWTLDHLAMNSFIRDLLTLPRPYPLTLLAASLTERYLLPGWQGWIPQKSRLRAPKTKARTLGLQHMVRQRLERGEVAPQYETLVRLAAAMEGLKEMEIVGGAGNDVGVGTEQEALMRYVGSMTLIRKQAPNAVYAVATMPVLDDDLQTRLLRREGSE